MIFDERLHQVIFGNGIESLHHIDDPYAQLRAAPGYFLPARLSKF